jgi:cytochrome c-type biogenesis protein
MEYPIAFLEGIATIISPCILPLLPLYLAYFAGNDEEGSTAKVARNALGFIIGFTILFVLMGVLAGAAGSFLVRYRTVVNIVLGGIVILFGLNFLGLIRFTPSRKTMTAAKVNNLGFFSSIVFGMVFALGWTPCVTAFLGSALLMASQQGSMMKGALLLLIYSVGLGVPLMACALVMNKIKGAIGFIKTHYDIINKVCGGLLVILGVLMAAGILA